ncbi:class I glutamine amidotransferase-like protein [Saccharata proteae CBS 121410]|uniref:Class I glutamine amidotransferase-like protein n=1 Tax=Saccharata proteae CBS 121410 TaxID=1314787 RepID=A0A9P4LTF3_9PEZI|nr:class I glutamine amidotransferase-like protein [Saccharata proteae CBS 121410]
MKPPFRIAVLECDTPMPQVVEQFGKYRDIFERLLKDGAEALGEEKGLSREDVQVSSYDVVDKEEYPDLEDVDAVLLTGSKHNSFDDKPWILKLVEFTKQVLAQRRARVIGICFGHQIIGRALGVKVDRSDEGWETSVLPMQLTEKGRQLFGQESINIHQMHRDIVYSYPAEVEPLGHSPRCSVQGMYAQGRLMTVQGHPEFNKDIMEVILAGRHEQGIFDDDLYRDSVKRAGLHHDGLLISQAFLRFLMEE